MICAGGVVLIKQVKRVFPLNKPIWVVHPVCRRQKVVTRTLLSACHRITFTMEIVGTYFRKAMQSCSQPITPVHERLPIANASISRSQAAGMAARRAADHLRCHHTLDGCLARASCANRGVWSAAAMLPHQPCFVPCACHAVDPAGYGDAVGARHDHRVCQE